MAETTTKKKRKKHYFLRFLIRIGIIVLIGYLLIRFVIPLKRMTGNNMYPSVRDGDLCVFYTFDEPHLDDVVMYLDHGVKRVARIIAIPGQSVEVTDEDGYKVNGYQPPEEIMYETKKNGDAVKYPLTVGSDEYFVMNDYPSDMEDSRTFGTIKKDSIIGKLFFVLRRRGF